MLFSWTTFVETAVSQDICYVRTTYIEFTMTIIGQCHNALNNKVRYISRTECSNYRFFNESNRARTYNKPVPVLCDTSLTGWYRFSGAAGSRMAETCVPYKHCATSAPGWLDGGHPTVFEGAVKRKVCFSGRTKCCSWTINISVRNCGDFYVYELKKPPHCNFRYCGNGISSTPGTTEFSRLPTESVYVRLMGFVPLLLKMVK